MSDARVLANLVKQHLGHTCLLIDLDRNALPYSPGEPRPIA